MTRRGSILLKRLLELRTAFGRPEARAKLDLLLGLEDATLSSALEVSRFHDALSFLRAYPDDREVLGVVERLLAGFGERPDLLRYRDALESSGIVGTRLHARFYWFTATWLARRWPRALAIDWEAYEDVERLEDLVYAVLEEHETLATEGPDWTLRGLLDALRAPDETDAVYLTRAIARLSSRPLVREWTFDGLDAPFRLDPSAGTPERTSAAFPVARTSFRSGSAPSPSPVRERIRTDPLRVRRVPAALGRELVDLGRVALITRGRDLFAFMHGDGRDVLLVDCGAGLQLACIGLLPDRRHLIYGQYVFLALMNGVPVGYVQACVLFDSAEVNFNVFDTFRGFDASRIFTSSLAATRFLFGVDAFDINPQQLGQDNPEALASGAWWFYYKHGFRPAPGALDTIVQRELRAKARDPGHRSSLETLERLSREHLFLFLGRPRRAVVCRVDLGAIGRSIARRVAEKLGVSGARATRASLPEAASLLRVRDLDSWSPDERTAWRRWAPLVVALPGVEGWSVAERRSLAAVIRKKGGRRETEFLDRLRAHPRLRRSLLELERAGARDGRGGP